MKNAADDDEERLVATLRRRLRAKEEEVGAGARALARSISDVIGRGLPLTELGDRVATPLQRARAEG